MVAGRVVIFSAVSLCLFVYALLVIVAPGAMDTEADSDSPDWGVVARGGGAMGLALISTIIAIWMIDV